MREALGFREGSQSMVRVWSEYGHGEDSDEEAPGGRIGICSLR